MGGLLLLAGYDASIRINGYIDPHSHPKGTLPRDHDSQRPCEDRLEELHEYDTFAHSEPTILGERYDGEHGPFRAQGN